MKALQAVYGDDSNDKRYRHKLKYRSWKNTQMLFNLSSQAINVLRLSSVKVYSMKGCCQHLTHNLISYMLPNSCGKTSFCFVSLFQRTNGHLRSRVSPRNMEALQSLSRCFWNIFLPRKRQIRKRLAEWSILIRQTLSIMWAMDR